MTSSNFSSPFNQVIKKKMWFLAGASSGQFFGKGENILVLNIAFLTKT